jgi:hypothetical protein
VREAMDGKHLEKDVCVRYGDDDDHDKRLAEDDQISIACLGWSG